jgi:hypothetical protein
LRSDCRTDEGGFFGARLCPKNGGCWALAKKKMREMTAKDIYELARQGAAFAKFDVRGDGKHGFFGIENATVAVRHPSNMRYCPRSEMTNGSPSTWNWRELKTECE